MWRSLLGNIPVVAVFLLTSFGAGCTTVPQREFKSYSEAFAEVKTSTERLLLEYDAAKRLEDANKRAASEAGEDESGESGPAFVPYPGSVTVSLTVGSRSSSDPVAARRQALEVVSDFNATLVSLAEGKKPEEVKSGIDSLSSGLGNVAGLVGTNLPIPFAGQISTLLSTVIAKLDEAKNREQFVAALKQAEPIIHGILHLFAQDAQDIYQIRARQADRLWMKHQDAVATLVRQMRAVAKEYAPPAGARADSLAALEKKVRQLLNGVNLKEVNAKLETTGGSAKPFDELALSQLDQTYAQAQVEADGYETVIKAQNALLQVVVSYGRLLGQTDTALAAVRMALDSPTDIRQQATELIGFAFTVKRDWEALNAARRAG